MRTPKLSEVHIKVNISHIINTASKETSLAEAAERVGGGWGTRSALVAAAVRGSGSKRCFSRAALAFSTADLAAAARDWEGAAAAACFNHQVVKAAAAAVAEEAAAIAAA